jgi:lysozyme
MSIRASAGLWVVVAITSGCMIGEDPIEDGDAKSGDGLADELAVDDSDAPPDQLRARVCATAGTTKGIDVSKWQGTINWTKVKAAGIEFAFIRVSDGNNTTDPKFAANWAGAKSAGLVRGAYQFFRPTQNVAAQAQKMIAAIGARQPGDLPPVMDAEDDGGLSPATVATRIRAWVTQVEAATGVRPIVYTGKYFWRDEVGGPSFAPSVLWIAQYTSLCPDIPAPWTRWTFWQHTDHGTVNGISGPVDMNRYNGSLAELRAYAGL